MTLFFKHVLLTKRINHKTNQINLINNVNNSKQTTEYADNISVISRSLTLVEKGLEWLNKASADA